MEELHTADDQSHYEISLTAGQAFMAFVLMMLSLAAAFAFGLMIGKGQADERLVVQKETPVVTEASLAAKKTDGKIVELGVTDDDFLENEAAEPKESVTVSSGADVAPSVPGGAEGASEAATATIVEAAAGDAQKPAAEATAAPQASATPVAPAPTRPLRITTYAQLLSTGDQKTAEALAAKLIDRGFTSSYVERGKTEKGPIYRVRVKFESEPEARAAEPKLREFSKEVWITTR